MLASPEWLGPMRYVAASAVAPLAYVQTIFSRVDQGAADPQTYLHADTFHASVKDLDQLKSVIRSLTRIKGVFSVDRVSADVG